VSPHDAKVRILQEPDAEAYAELRREALLDSPLAFASSPADDVAGDIDAVRALLRRGPESVVLGTFDDRRLIASAGLYRDRHVKAAHRAHLWGLYVRPSYRRQGLGARVVRAVLRHAESLPGVDCVELSVSSEAPGALRLYESLGFRTWGTEPDALRYEGRTASQHHMLVRLASGSPGTDAR
jgi:RimJ/RimL family protein N-acetyltransferase